MNELDKIKEIQGKILSHSESGLIFRIFSESICELHMSNPVFYNHIFKYSRINTLSVLMSLLFSEKVNSLTDFYKICSENNFSGKNNAISLMDFMIYSERITLGKEKDRRKKTPVLTDKGRDDLNSIMKVFIKSLYFYDNNLIEGVVDTDFYYKKYYDNAALLLDVKPEWFNVDKFAREIYTKSSGMAFILMIYKDIVVGKIKAEDALRGSYFSNFSYDLGISNSHALNLLAELVDSEVIIKDEREYKIKTDFVGGVEKFISSYLATVYFLMFR